jgi:hypothetical protein
MPIEERANTRMLSAGIAIRKEQSGHGIEAGVVQAIRAAGPLSCVRQHPGFLERLLSPRQTIENELS